MMHRRTRKEMKRDSEAHYHSMEDHAPDPQAAERFRRKPYTGVRVLIRRQGEQIGDTAEYLAEKYNIRGDADGQERTERIRRHERGNQGSEAENRRGSEEN